MKMIEWRNTAVREEGLHLIEDKILSINMSKFLLKVYPKLSHLASVNLTQIISTSKGPFRAHLSLFYQSYHKHLCSKINLTEKAGSLAFAGKRCLL